MKNFLLRLMRWLVNGIPNNVTYAKITQVEYKDRLKNINAIITGGGHGLGYYIAKKIISNGGRVVITGRNVEKLKSASVKLDNCPYIAFDVQDHVGYEQFIHDAELALGGNINSLINNAGVSLHEQSYLDVTLEDFDTQFNINIKSPYFLTQCFLKYIKSKRIKFANVIFVTSERGMYGDSLPYGLTKAAINSLTKGLSRRFVTEGIRINAIAPGVTASDMTRIDKTDNLYRENSCGKRVFVPEEVAEVASFLLSEESNCITGHIIPCNQGNHLRSDY